MKICSTTTSDRRMTRPLGALGGHGEVTPSRLLREERGAATAEYAITIMAAVGFAGLLVLILRSGEVQQVLTDLVRDALTVAG